MATSVRSERVRQSIKRVDYLNLLRGAESEEASESSGEELGESESENSDTETENNDESSSDSDPQHSRQKSNLTNVNRLPCASSSRTSAAHRKRTRPDNLTDRYVYLKTSIFF